MIKYDITFKQIPLCAAPLPPPSTHLLHYPVSRCKIRKVVEQHDAILAVFKVGWTSPCFCGRTADSSSLRSTIVRYINFIMYIFWFDFPCCFCSHLATQDSTSNPLDELRITYCFAVHGFSEIYDLLKWICHLTVGCPTHHVQLSSLVLYACKLRFRGYHAVKMNPYLEN